MGIKSIFSMLKADRYTQDGRDKLAEDKTYQTGQISEKTGLQKQPDGSWKPPKNGNGKTVRPMESAAGNKPAAPTGNEEQRKRKNFMENSQKNFEAANSVATTETDKTNLKKIKSFMDEEHGTFKNALYNNAESLVRKGSNGAPDRENEKSLLKFAEAAGMGDDLKLYLKEEVNSKYDFGGGDAEKKPAQSKLKLPDEKSSFSTDINRLTKIKQSGDYKLLGREMEKLHSKYPINKWTELNRKITAAPDKPAEKKPDGAGNSPAAPKPSVQEYMKAQDTVKKYEETYKKQLEEYENGQRLRANGGGAILDPMYGLKPNDLSKNADYMKAKDIIQRMEAEDSAPQTYTAQTVNAPREKLARTLTGDTKIKVRRK